MPVDLETLLEKTSRTFALAIPLLPQPTQREVAVAYLLFRIADTFEDATSWSRRERITALEDYCGLLRSPREGRDERCASLVKQWSSQPPLEHAGYLELIAQTGGVISELDAMPAAMQEILVRHTVRTAQGMASVVNRADERGNLRLSSVQDLQDYCYIVAGIVGELLTQVFLFDSPSLAGERATLEAQMIAFGEGLQLVNILKDASDDARDGRVYLPPGVSKAEVFALARADLDGANRYVQSLQRGEAPRGYLAFCGISLMLAFASLDRLEKAGPGSKVSREDVARLFGVLQGELDAGARLDLRVASR